MTEFPSADYLRTQASSFFVRTSLFPMTAGFSTGLHLAQKIHIIVIISNKTDDRQIEHKQKQGIFRLDVVAKYIISPL